MSAFPVCGRIVLKWGHGQRSCRTATGKGEMDHAIAYHQQKSIFVDSGQIYTANHHFKNKNSTLSLPHQFNFQQSSGVGTQRRRSLYLPLLEGQVQVDYRCQCCCCYRHRYRCEPSPGEGWQLLIDGTRS